MTNTQRLTIRASEIRQRLNEIAGLEGDALTDEIRQESDRLTTEYRDTETKLRAAITTDPEPVEIRHADTAEGRELRALIDGADMASIYGAALEHRATEGQTRELQEHYGIAFNEVPLAMLEQRAVTPAPDDVGTNAAPIVPAVFPQAAAAFLGIETPVVPTGDAVFPVLSTSATAHTPAEGSDADDTTGAFSADVLTPKRIQAAFFYSREDRARFVGMDEALRDNLGMALGDALDKQVLIQNPNGLFHGTNLANHARGAATAYVDYVEQLYGRVDGKFAGSVSDIRVLVGSPTYADMAGTYRADESQDMALGVYERASGGVRVSAHVPGVAGSKQNMLIRRGMRRDFIAPIWEGVQLIPDEITMAKKGQITVTAVMLYNVKLLRAGGFYKQETNHS